MKSIGVTGGVGSGKTEILRYLEKHYRCGIIIADEVAHRVSEPGESCYQKLTELLGRDILRKDGRIDRIIMAEKIFKDAGLLHRVNDLIHPAVKQYITCRIREEKESGKLDFLFVEAALLLEDHYSEILDEIWYIHAGEGIRKCRLSESRAYSHEKTDDIIGKQLKEDDFRKCCQTVIDNSGSLEDTFRQINEKLGEYL